MGACEFSVSGGAFRHGQLTQFRTNLTLPATDPQRRFVFSTHGDGGVGKTFLIRRPATARRGARRSHGVPRRERVCRRKTHQALKRYDEALADFTRTIELDPDFEWAITNRGWTYQFMKRYDEALTDFTRSLELDPDKAWAIATRSQTYQAVKRYNEALIDIDRALELDDDPEDGWYRYLRAIVLFFLDRGSEATAELASAVALVRSRSESSDDPLADTMNLVVYLAALGDFATARTDIEKILQQRPSAHIVAEAIDELRNLTTVPGVDVPGIEELIARLTEPAG
ncbi:lipoprotein NlpI [Catenulispora sp. GP43]|uniref:tetratricopeptide repeat protein n=1 Tax=Catenulispora sp. GP43 TaxID=3156263 RepID=UPI003514052D